MKPAAFEYQDPRTLGQACELLDEYGADAVLLAGGQSLLPLLARRELRPRVVVDLSRVPGLDQVAEEGDQVRVGAMVRQRRLEVTGNGLTRHPLLTVAVGRMGPPQVRNRGTVGGSLALGLPSATLPAAALALGATFVVASVSGTRLVTADEFYHRTGARPPTRADVLVEARFPRPQERTGTALEVVSPRAGATPVAGAAVAVTMDGAGWCTAARVVLIGLTPWPRRAPSVERVLVGTPVGTGAVGAAAGSVGPDLEPVDDRRATADYRRAVASVLVERALTRAWGRAQAGPAGPRSGTRA